MTGAERGLHAWSPHVSICTQTLLLILIVFEQERLAENLARIKDLQANIVMSTTDQQGDDKAHPSQLDPENIT